MGIPLLRESLRDVFSTRYLSSEEPAVTISLSALREELQEACESHLAARCRRELHLGLENGGSRSSLSKTVQLFLCDSGPGCTVAAVVVAPLPWALSLLPAAIRLCLEQRVGADCAWAWRLDGWVGLC